MLYAVRPITAVDMDGHEYTTVEAKPYSPDLDPSVWTAVEAESILDITYDGGAIKVLTPEGKLAKYKAIRIGLLKTAGKEVVYTHAPEYKQVNAALGVYGASATALIKTWIQIVRTIVDEKEAAINGAADKTAADTTDISYESIYTTAWASLTPEQQQGLLTL